MIKMATCREIVDLLAKELDITLPLSSKVGVLVHIALCRDCRTYRQQIRHVETYLRTWAKESVNSIPELTEEELNSIADQLEQCDQQR